jgi:hypothetical protein
VPERVLLSHESFAIMEANLLVPNEDRHNAQAVAFLLQPTRLLALRMHPLQPKVKPPLTQFGHAWYLDLCVMRVCLAGSGDRQ